MIVLSWDFTQFASMSKKMLDSRNRTGVLLRAKVMPLVTRIGSSGPRSYWHVECPSTTRLCVNNNS